MPATFAYFEYRQFRLAAACAECMNKKYKLPSLSLLNMSCRICLNGSFYIIVIIVFIVGFFIPVSSLKVFAHSIHSERRRIYLGKSIQSLQNDTIIISWVFSFRVIQPTMRWHTFKTFMFAFITSCSS